MQACEMGEGDLNVRIGADGFGLFEIGAGGRVNCGPLRLASAGQGVRNAECGADCDED